MRTKNRCQAGRLLAAAIAASFCLMAVAPAVAAQAQPPRSPEAQGEFVPVKDLPAQEQLPATPLVTGAYAFVWVVLFVYVWSVWRRLGRVEREMGHLAARLAERPRRG